MEMEFEGNAETATATATVPFVVDMLDCRAKGNQLFAQEEWKGAIACYSNYIDFALNATENFSRDEERVALLYAYSNRAEARLRLEEYGKAVEDCDKALQFHSAHLKSIFRKGRALHGLCEYKIACDYFQQALHLSPASNEIKALYQKSKKLNEQNRAGKFDLYTYFLRGCRPQDSPEVSNYMGPVVIQKSPGRGRGLFATKNVDIGDMIVVENAAAACSMYRRAHPCILEDNEMSEIERLKNETVAQVISRAMSSPRIFQQLQYLISDSDIPDMELFQINEGNWKKFDACENFGNLQLETDKLRRLMDLNALLTHMTQMKNLDEVPFDEDGSIWTGIITIEGWGFWVLPSFVNHSCFPNANCMVVGKAMYIIAARKISAAEEITVSYFKNLTPMPLRELFCRQLGFRCECKRCMFERSLGEAYQNLGEKMVSSYKELVPHVPHVPPTDILYLLELVAQVEKTNAADSDDEGKKLIHASFTCIYSLFHRFYPDIVVPSRLLPTPTTLVEAIQHVSPGCDSSFNLHSRLVKQASKQQKNVLVQKLMEVGVTMIGKHEKRVLKALLRTEMEERWIKVSKVWDGSTAQF